MPAMRTPRLALPLVVALASLALAGCSDGGAEEPTGPPPPTASSYLVTVEGFPVTPVPSNTTFTFTDRITGEEVRASDHIGAHFGANSTQAPSTTAYPFACVHTQGDLPGTYQVTCTAPTLPGTYYLRGHARIGQGNESVSWWSGEQTFLVIA
jgi:hypothetical protein